MINQNENVEKSMKKSYIRAEFIVFEMRYLFIYFIIKYLYQISAFAFFLLN